MSTPDEETLTFPQWQELSEAERLDIGFAHEFYCTLCGIPFWLYLTRHRGTFESDEDCFAWASFFLARK